MSFACDTNSSVGLPQSPAAARRRGFTLLEIMIVVGIMGLILAGLVPTLIVGSRKEGFRKTVADIVEVCEGARRRAIVSSSMIEVHFYPQERRVSLGASSGEGEGQSATSASWSENVTLEMLDVNLTEWKDTEDARVRFYPNGTSDEMTVILRSENNEFKKITLEPMTALVSAEPLIR